MSLLFALLFLVQGALPDARGVPSTEGQERAEGAVPSEYVVSLRDAAADLDDLIEAGELDRAKELLAEIARRVSSTPEPPSRAEFDALQRLAARTETLAALEPRVVFRKRALEALERALPAEHPDVIVARGNYAMAVFHRGDLAGARTLLESMLADVEHTLPAGHPDLLAIRGNLALALRALGDASGARALLETVVEEAQGRALPADHPHLLRARLELSSTLCDLGDLAGARALQEAVMEACRRTLPADHPDLLTARMLLGVTMMEMGDPRGARGLFEAVLQTSERTLLADHPKRIAARGNLASAMLAMNDLAAARALFEDLLETLERAQPVDASSVLRTRQNLGLARAKMGDYAGARAVYEAALESRGALPADHPDLLPVQANLATALRELGDLSGARALQEAVLETFGAKLSPESPVLALVRTNLAIAMFESGDRPDALALGLEIAGGMLHRLELASVLAPREAREVVADEADRHSTVRFLTKAEAAAGTRSMRFELAETLRAVASASAGAAGTGDPRRREISTLRARLNDLVSGGPSEGQSSEAFAAEVSRRTLERDRLERAVRGDLAREGIVAGAIRAVDVARALPEGAAAVGFLREKKHAFDAAASKILSVGEVLTAHVLLADGSLTEVEFGAADELEALAGAWRSSLGKPIERGVALEVRGGEVAAGNALRVRLLDPILAAAGDGTTTLFVCPDDFLHLVPLDALPLGAGDEAGRVGDRYRIVNEVSFARLVAARPAPAGAPTLLALGGVAFDAQLGSEPATPAEVGAQGFAPLLQTRFEAESVSALFEQELGEDFVLLTKAEATKAAFHEQAPGKRFLHVATHGWFAPETLASTLDPRDEDRLWSPMDAQETITGLAPMTLCGLALASANRGRDALGRVPGILTAEELAGIDLTACELAVLSACETNVGIRRAGQGIQSLQAALHAAGARTAITSLWKVDDAVTRRLMELFYGYLWVDEMPKAEALWRAKSGLRREGAAVRDWAGWVLTGDPR